MTQETHTFTVNWQGITLSVAYHPKSFLSFAHLEVRSLHPARAPLPITETGYRSHFLDRAEIEAFGGPETYVRAWLDDRAQTPEWRPHMERSRQGSLF